MPTSRRVPTVAGIAAAVGLAVIALAGLSACTVTRSNALVDGFTQAQPVTAVRLEHGGSGDVTVQTDPSVTGLDLRRTVHYLQSKPGQTAHMEGSTLVLTMDCGVGCNVSYQVRVPVGVSVSGSNSSGDITLHGVTTVDVSVSSGNVDVRDATGAVTVRATSGDVTLTDVAGPTMVHVTSGDIRASGLRGATHQLEATSGDIEAALAAPAAVTATATSGDIKLRVPDGSYRVDAHASSGDTSVQVVNDPAGTYLLDLNVGSGDITVTHA